MKKNVLWISLIFLFSATIVLFVFPKFLGNVSYDRNEQKAKAEGSEENQSKFVIKTIPPLDVIAYDQKLLELANNPPPKPPVTKVIKDPKTGVETTVIIPPKPTPPSIWPVKTVYPKDGALLPFNRIVAYYGNLYSTRMGVLGQYPEDEMLGRLDVEVKKWEEADLETRVVPALHYIAVVAQDSPGFDGKYRARMPDSEIEKVLAMADKINGIVFLDLQVGFSTVEVELPRFEKYLKLPNVHLGLDPEFSMKGGIRPGKAVGTFDAADINFTADFLAKVVKENNLTPKILVVHRYTQKMVTNYEEIKLLPEVQIVMNMDGFGGMEKKIGTYQSFIYSEPVQFAGFKLFYRNDVATPGTSLMTPSDLLKLRPRPIYIQYQ
ncbi:hypothetical protein A3A03_03805 [Candidatus Nomurabacteria bacterium RIFCSPLOWO2_01_FULL_40_18]|uniref:Lipoprotein n=1 Tax=Candidatus Nomurabacteria bacterium RIFCSPLOWO2_01_FULL_40_18 TaxID=1801773 RepID=A0A1F6XK29_9BACT|nr:MAG: hypothetical protein A3A03_03805 [Candidatus Nomurabacteria bacterium RIFCSPLOWO2_01_FULL_40_18]